MTLARILLLGICCTAWTPALWSVAPLQPVQPQAPANDAGASQPQGTAQTQTEIQPSASAETSTQTATEKKKPKRVRHKNTSKKPSACASTPDANPGTAPSGASNQSSVRATQGQGPAIQAATNCPPPKIIVRQGGTSESSIELAGGPNQSSQARTTTAPMLEAAEANLKKLEGHDLSDGEKDMVTQIRQFMEQSKTAVAAGDVERARTLAWKAQTLSEDLVAPPK